MIDDSLLYDGSTFRKDNKKEKAKEIKQVSSCIIKLGCTFHFEKEEEDENESLQFKEFLKQLKSIPHIEEILSVDWCDVEYEGED